MNNSYNKKQQPRMITSEEMQKTQVLNLEAVEEVARFERRTSKKPAILFAILGMFLISCGTTLSVVQSLSKEQELSQMEKRKNNLVEEKVPVQTKLSCTLTSLNNPDGTDTVFNIQFQFLDGGLNSFIKTFSVIPTAGNPLGPTTVQNYLTAYNDFLNPVNGYQISVVPNETGLVSVVKVDYSLLNVSQLSPKQNDHFSTSLDYQMGTNKQTIYTNLTAQNYVCE